MNCSGRVPDAAKSLQAIRGGAAEVGSSSAPTSHGAVRICASTSPWTTPLSVAPAFQARLPAWMWRFSVPAPASMKLRLASARPKKPLPRGLGPMSEMNLPVGGAASPTMLSPLAAFHQSQFAAFVHRAWPFQVTSGACTSSTMMLLRSTT